LLLSTFYPDKRGKKKRERKKWVPTRGANKGKEVLNVTEAGKAANMEYLG